MAKKMLFQRNSWAVRGLFVASAVPSHRSLDKLCVHKQNSSLFYTPQRSQDPILLQTVCNKQFATFSSLGNKTLISLGRRYLYAKTAEDKTEKYNTKKGNYLKKGNEFKNIDFLNLYQFNSACFFEIVFSTTTHFSFLTPKCQFPEK